LSLAVAARISILASVIPLWLLANPVVLRPP
jgi:hypothetical protein